MHNIKVVIHGAMGKMGKETVNAVCRESDLDPLGKQIIEAAIDKCSVEEFSNFKL